MRSLILELAISLLIASPVVAAQQPGRVDNARTLADICRPVQRSLANSGPRRKVPLASGMLCLGYMQGMQDISVLTDESGQRVFGTCPSEDTTLGQLIDAFVSYADSHRDQLDDKPVVIVIKAFRHSFPCTSSEGPVRKP
jgi:Rap1a immunity proteins